MDITELKRRIELALFDGAMPFIRRRDKMQPIGSQYQVVRLLNEDWQECLYDDQMEIVGFPSQEDADEHYQKAVTAWITEPIRNDWHPRRRREKGQ